MGVIGPGGVGYYLNTVASGVDDYYLKAEPGLWYGRGAEELELEGVVTPEQLHALLDARDPTGGEALGTPPAKVAAFDLTFSAPKSVSVLAEMASPEVRAVVTRAHHRAVAGAVELIEAHAVRGRRGHAGAVEVSTAGLVGAGFDHHSSRAGDPQLHTHLLVVNRARGADGRWGALYGQRIFAWAKTAGVAYQAHLRAGLTEALGVTWGPVLNGMADLAGVPNAVIGEFSTRRAQIVAALAEFGHDSPAAAQVAALATRSAKPEPVEPDLQRQRWWERARVVGLDPDLLDGLVGPGRRPSVIDPDTLAVELASPAGLTARRSTFDRRHVLQGVAAAHPEGITPARLAASTDLILAHPGLLGTGTEARLAGPCFTTVELAATEARLLDAATRRQGAGVAACAPEAIAAAIDARASLSAEQAELVARICGAGHGIDVVVGRPGTGKTYALDAARAAWSAAGVPVIGVAVAARTARALEAGTGIPSGTVDQLLADLARPDAQALPVGAAVVVDEAGMVGTRTLARLADAVEARQAKLVLVGDPAQLPEIDAGGAFAALARLGPTVELTLNRRQAHAWERAALEHVRAGRPLQAVGAYSRHEALLLTDTAEAARSALVGEWAAAHDPTRPERAVMVALTRADTDDLNARARAFLQDAGLVSPEVVRVGQIDFGVGDRVMTLRNDRRLGVLNGTAGTVTAANAEGTITFRPDRADTEITLPADYLAAGRLSHAWAITIHKAQGLTVDEAFVLGTERLYREAGYVALSRATQATRWYQVAPAGLSPYGTEIAPEVQAARALARSGAQHLATELPERDGPAAHLLAALGPEPPPGPERLAWQGGAIAIEGYRARHHISGPDPLGPQPTDPDRAAEWAQAHRSVERARRQLVELQLG
ncbi:MAG: MobF family relaxase, partial [Acidimicrobiales bacterium]